MPHVDTAFGRLPGKTFPGQVLALGCPDGPEVLQLQQRLNALGCGPVPDSGTFDRATKRGVRLFQSRFPDATGLPLFVDGEVGALTWGALFGGETVPANVAAPSTLAAAALAFAISQIGVMERPLGSNRGPEVDAYVRATGLDPRGGFAWCVAFTHFCYLSAAQHLGMPNPHIQTAGVLAHWNKSASVPGILRVKRDEAVADPARVRPGALFIIDLGGGLGHSGMVESTANGRLVTVEGNTNDAGSRNGIGVFRRTARKIVEINKGFVDYGGF